MKQGSIVASAILVFGFCFITFSSSLAANLPREHDRGFFLRMSAGGGTARTEVADVYNSDLDVTGDLEFSGTAGEANFAIGAIVSPNLALHATLAGWSVSDPDVEFAGLSGEMNNSTLSMSMLGAGVTYYLMPVNIYLSGSVGAARLNIDASGNDEDSDTGLAVDLTAGKEWWVGARWGLGVAIGANFHSIPSGDPPPDDVDFKGSSFAVRFSATMN